MTSDDYHIPEEYNVCEDEIRQFIDDIGRDYIYLNTFIDKFHYFLKEAEKVEVENSKYSRFGHSSIKDFGYSHYFPNTLNYSFIVFAFITFENHLRIMMNIIYDNRHSAEDFQSHLKKNYRGGNFEKYLAFYEDRMDVKYSEFKYWQQIAKLAKIRNCIVHVSGYLLDSRDETDLRATVKARSYLSAEDKLKSKFLYPSKDFLENGGVVVDDYEERLVIGEFYCKRLVWYWQNFMNELIYHSGMAIYAGWDN